MARIAGIIGVDEPGPRQMAKLPRPPVRDRRARSRRPSARRPLGSRQARRPVGRSRQFLDCRDRRPIDCRDPRRRSRRGPSRPIARPDHVPSTVGAGRRSREKDGRGRIRQARSTGTVPDGRARPGPASTGPGSQSVAGRPGWDGRVGRPRAGVIGVTPRNGKNRTLKSFQEETLQPPRQGLATSWIPSRISPGFRWTVSLVPDGAWSARSQNGAT